MHFLLLPPVLSLPIPMENVNVLENAFGFLEQTTSHSFSAILGELKQRPWFYQSFEKLSPVTLFAPTDNAWATLPQYFWNSPELQQERYEMIQYHTVPRSIIFKGISYGVYSNFSTLSPGNDLLLKRNGTGIYLLDGIRNEIEIVAQVMIRNVVVYGINGVLNVPQTITRFLRDITHETITLPPLNQTESQNATQLSKDIQKVLNGTDGFTFLMPRANLLANNSSCPNGTRISHHSLWNMFKYHLFPQKFYLMNFRGVDHITSVANQTWKPLFTRKGIELSTMNNHTWMNSTIAIHQADTLVQNGVVHQIDRSLLPHNFSFHCEWV
jgi:uncharacterized surface protein with fasciclin (FAS1) repeats